MRVVLDANIWIDIAARPKTYPESAEILRILELRGDFIFLPLCAYTTIYYVLQKVLSASAAVAFLKILNERKIKMLSFGEREVQKAQELQMSDHEDACVVASSISARADYIVTRNVKAFKGSSIECSTSEEFLKKVLS